MEVNPRLFPDTQAIEVYLPSLQAVNYMITKTMENMGNKFFTYSTLNNNCQDFMVSFLKVNGLLSETLLHFVKQDVKNSFDGMIGLQKALNTATDIAGRFDVLKQGGSEGMSQNNGLTNIQLDEILSHIQIYGSSYAKDKLPIHLKKGYWYIANMQNERDGNGTHWVCFKYGYPVCYYDPFGLPMSYFCMACFMVSCVAWAVCWWLCTLLYIVFISASRSGSPSTPSVRVTACSRLVSSVVLTLCCKYLHSTVCSLLYSFIMLCLLDLVSMCGCSSSLAGMRLNAFSASDPCWIIVPSESMSMIVSTCVPLDSCLFSHFLRKLLHDSIPPAFSDREDRRYTQT